MRAIGRLLVVFFVAFSALFVPAQTVAQAQDEAPLTNPYANRWIEVDLTLLVAIAWDGSTQVYSAPVSAGRPGFDTPTGDFRVLKRIANETMDSATVGIPRGAPGSYYVTNVRYTQYFTNGGHALHANYWSSPSAFGHWNDSHGCVGMRTDDAAFFWDFATFGTPVRIHRSDRAIVPSVAGLKIEEATAKLAEAGFQVQVTEGLSNDLEVGTVMSQDPAPSTLLSRGGAVNLIVCSGPLVAPVRPPEGEQAWVPETVGLTEEEARARIAEAGLNTGYTNYQVESDIPADLLPFFNKIKPGSVLSTSPGYGTAVPRGSTVQIAVRQP